MGTIFVENNQEIDVLVRHLDDKIVKFRRDFPNNKSILKVKHFYDLYISPWMENHFVKGIEVERDVDIKVKDGVLDLINIVDKIRRAEESNRNLN